MSAIAANVHWVKAKRSAIDRHYGMVKRWIAFIGSNAIAEVYENDFGTSHGTFLGDRIGSCMTLDGAKRCVEARWLDVIASREPAQ